MKKQSFAQFEPNKNREKLLQQNVKLNKEIFLLEQKMSSVITMDVTKAVEADRKNSEGKGKINEITMQQAYIKKLKIKIKQLKALNLGEVTNGIVNEQNEIVVLKRQYDKLQEEKKVLGKKFGQKTKALEYNNPLNQFKSETETELGRVRKKNNDLASKIVELQREVRKFHKYQQMNKKFKDQKILVQNPEYEFAKIDHEKAAVVKKTKLLEAKWKPQMDALDKEYFQTKDIFLKTQIIIKQLEKQLKNWQNRASAARNEGDVIMDRQRLAKVISVSPRKNENSPKKKNEGQGFADFLKNLLNKYEKQKQKNSNNIKEIKQPLEERPNIRRWDNIDKDSRYGSKSEKVKPLNQQKLNFTRLSQKNEFINSKHSFQGFDLKNLKNFEGKKNKVMNSIAVGTSFYYNEDQ